jgi:endonuclease/exonuclease/phosphatase family metal-dependent hydrolase
MNVLRLLTAVQFLLVIATGTLLAAGPQAPLKVMSFNVRYGTANDGKDAWPERRDLVVRTIQAYGPDLLGTQEMLPFQAQYIHSKLPDYEYFGWSRDESNDGEQCGIYVRKERFKVVESGQFWLSDTPETKFSKSWDSSLPRVLTWIRIEDRRNQNQPLLFANTHFDHRGIQARLNSAILCRGKLQELAAGLPVLLTGDFNCGSESAPAKELLKDTQLIDSYSAVSHSAEESVGTFHGFHGKPGRDRIDWILLSPALKTLEAAIDRTNESGRYPSDHFPVTAIVALP